MRKATIILSLLLLSLAQPNLVDAKVAKKARTSSKGGTTAKSSLRSKQAKAQNRGANGQFASGFKATAKTNAPKADKATQKTSKLQKAPTAKKAAFGPAISTGLRLNVAKKLRKGGQLQLAASKIAAEIKAQRSFKVTGEAKGIRAQFAKFFARANRKVDQVKLGIATRKLTRNAKSLAKSRAKNGDVAGVKDALSALKTIESAQGTRPGLIGILRAELHNRAVFRNLRKGAKNAIKNGNLEAANQAMALTANAKLGGSLKAQTKTNQAMLGASMKLAKSYAKNGQLELATQALQFAEHIATTTNQSINPKSVAKIEKTAYTKAIPQLTREAGQLYKIGQTTQAASYLAFAREISKQTGIKPGFRTKSKQSSLARKLGPELTRVEAANAQQSAQHIAAEQARIAQAVQAAAGPSRVDLATGRASR